MKSFASKKIVDDILTKLYVDERLSVAVANPTYGFRDYLEAKLSVDGASLNKEIFSLFLSKLRRLPSPVLLDLGTGTGAMIRRIIASGAADSAEFFGLDSSRELLDDARRRTAFLLEERGYSVELRDASIRGVRGIFGVRGAARIAVHFVLGDLFDPELPRMLGVGRFDGVTANAFMDLVPPRDAIEVIEELLKAGGIFYPTINYDGMTEMLPFHDDRGFEERLWKHYNGSMDERRLGSKRTGGSRSGSILYDVLSRTPFEIAGFGSSDWVVSPRSGTYRPDEELFLKSILAMVYEEGSRNAEIEAQALSGWYHAKIAHLNHCRLSLIVHQTDLLAVLR